MPIAEPLPRGRTVPRTSPLLSFVIEAPLLKAVDDWRFAHRFPSRAAAIKELLRWAVAQNPDLRPDEA